MNITIIGICVELPGCGEFPVFSIRIAHVKQITEEMWKIYNMISVKGKSKQQQQGTFIATAHSNTTEETPV
ncbi:unnamed protein product [Ambrosiozyma monospora]|uniref:Unnamed protein product n=1 Tax=Ambrosiozyma monospora TaxID=43982 RepID=A0A9W7DG36_AMBMO|nr:unnamed protein product [Ambrosiozyma monospora]